MGYPEALNIRQARVDRRDAAAGAILPEQARNCLTLSTFASPKASMRRIECVFRTSAL